MTRPGCAGKTTVRHSSTSASRGSSVCSITTKIIPHKAFATREEFDRAVNIAFEVADIDIVCLAGFMRLLSAHFVREFPGRILNIHPSLLPAFAGLQGMQPEILKPCCKASA